MTENTDLSGSGPQATRVQMVAARLCGVRPAELADGAGPETRFARHLAMYLANRVYRISHARSAAMFGRARYQALSNSGKAPFSFAISALAA